MNNIKSFFGYCLILVEVWSDNRWYLINKSKYHYAKISDHYEKDENKVYQLKSTGNRHNGFTWR